MNKGLEEQDNPFFYGGIVRNEFFCNRILEKQELKRDIHNGLNLLIYAPRRFGKTSFVLQTLEELECKFVFIDFMSILSIEDFINKYFNAIAKNLKEPMEKVIDFCKNILKIKPNISVNFGSNGEANFSLNFSANEVRQTLEDVLNLPFLLAKKGKKFVVVFDEFQEIENFGYESLFRSCLQMHGKEVSYIFMGSKKSLLDSMFMDKKRAFYKSVKHFIIDTISLEDWSEFIQKRFSAKGKQIETHFIEEIFKITKGFPYYTQQFAYELWNFTQNAVDEKCFQTTLKLILERENDYFALEWENLTKNQRIALKIVLEQKGAKLYDNALLKNSSLQTALNGLKVKDILDKRGQVYYLVDPVFEYWLKECRGLGI
ncbi:AAA family ATPase [Helicobacter burdigaliensis]|uniref:AAA family ATPase n=1 Tax=Helicobacter burdigaliensis TaxID=2315334 RepID=UPI000EF66616|nr:ATP-binding protein [Helicobacter burdigaliensis]